MLRIEVMPSLCLDLDLASYKVLALTDTKLSLERLDITVRRKQKLNNIIIIIIIIMFL